MENFMYVQNQVNATLMSDLNKVFENTLYNNKYIKRVNRRCMVGTLVGLYLVGCVCAVLDDNKKQIERLTKEIEEMKNQKGE